MKPPSVTRKRPSPPRAPLRLTDVTCNRQLDGGLCTGRLHVGRLSCERGKCGVACTKFHWGYQCRICGWRGDKPLSPRTNLASTIPTARRVEAEPE